MPALVAGIHVLLCQCRQDVDGRDEARHDGQSETADRIIIKCRINEAALPPDLRGRAGERGGGAGSARGNPRSATPPDRPDCLDAPASGRNKPSSNLLPHRLQDAGEIGMARHMRPAHYVWGYDWPDDCPPPSYRRVIFTHPAPAHARVALQLPPCQPHAGVNTDWSGHTCALLHRNSGYALLTSPPAQLVESQSVPATQTPVTRIPVAPAPVLQPPQAPVLQPPQPHALEPAPAAQPISPKPAAEPVTVGQVAPDHVHPEPVTANLGYDVAIGLCLILAFFVVRRSILDLIETERPSSRP
jgi:hypothetical protein